MNEILMVCEGCGCTCTRDEIVVVQGRELCQNCAGDQDADEE